MDCPDCGGATTVKDNRRSLAYKRKTRRRRCTKCGYRFSTIEMTTDEVDKINELKALAKQIGEL